MQSIFKAKIHGRKVSTCQSMFYARILNFFPKYSHGLKKGVAATFIHTILSTQFFFNTYTLNTLIAKILVDENFGPNFHFGPNFSSTNLFADQNFRRVTFTILQNLHANYTKLSCPCICNFLSWFVAIIFHLKKVV